VSNKYKASVIVPSTDYSRLKNFLSHLSRQIVKPYEVILVLKGINPNQVIERIQSVSKCIIIEQTKGYFTSALNLGKKEVTGDIAIFTDDDALAPPRWIEKYVKLHKVYGNKVACISSRDLYLDPKTRKLKPTPDDFLRVKLFRSLVRPWLEKPHPLLKKYRLGVYLTKSYKVAHGPYIPAKPCYSLPFRGVNMSFKRETLDIVKFPEDPLLKRAPGNEQYVGLQLIMKGYESMYVPDNPILHIIRESLSRTRDEEIKMELRIMKSLYIKLISGHVKSNDGVQQP
jgi:glycosyltransferase involved in cell wall biosynthesis